MKQSNQPQQSHEGTESSWQFYLVIAVIAFGVLAIILKGIGLF